MTIFSLTFLSFPEFGVSLRRETLWFQHSSTGGSDDKIASDAKGTGVQIVSMQIFVLLKVPSKTIEI